MSREIAEAWFAAFRQRDIHSAPLADGFVHSSPFGTISNKQAYLDLVAANEEAFYSPEIEIVDMITGDNSVAVRYLVNGNPACDCIYMQGGLISMIHSYYHYGEKPQF